MMTPEESQEFQQRCREAIEHMELLEEDRRWQCQYILWAEQFVPEDAKFTFDPDLSVAAAYAQAEKDCPVVS